MTGYREILTKSSISRSPFVLLILVVVFGTASAQGVTDRQRELSGLERARDSVASHDAGAKQFNEDFLGLQTVDADMMKAFAPAAAIDYKRISDDAAEIRKRAIRMRDYLMLPSAKKEKPANAPDASDPDRLESTLPALKDLIQNFVKSPIFQTQRGRADYRELSKARRNIDDIIDLSAAVKKTAEKMGK